MLMLCTPQGISSRALRRRWVESASNALNAPQPCSVSCRQMAGSAVPYSACICAAN